MKARSLLRQGVNSLCLVGYATRLVREGFAPQPQSGVARHPAGVYRPLHPLCQGGRPNNLQKLNTLSLEVRSCLKNMACFAKKRANALTGICSFFSKSLALRFQNFCSNRKNCFEFRSQIFRFSLKIARKIIQRICEYP